MVILSVIIYTLFGSMCLWFIISGVRKIKEIRSSQALSEFYTDEEEHNKAIADAEAYEKGYFEMGGSTCVVMLKKGAAIIDEDILENSANGTETKVLMGERTGRKNA